jgi:endoglucanase
MNVTTGLATMRRRRARCLVACAVLTASVAASWIILSTHILEGRTPSAAIAFPVSALVDNNGAYRVIGGHILNSRGQAVIVHGVNRSSLENSCTGATVTGQQTGIPAADFTTIHDTWGATVVRLPLDQEFWLTNCHNYRDAVKKAVREIEGNHMLVILDLHWWTKPPDLSFATTAQAMCMPNENSITFWRQVAYTYSTHPNVWFELYNEPSPPGSTPAAQWHTWLAGGLVNCANDYTGLSMGQFRSVGMQQLINTIRSSGADNIILADGINKAFTLAGVPRLAGTNIAYAVHPYLNNPTVDATSGWSVGAWNERFGALASEVPVVATEFGDFECGDTAYARAYDRAILSYFRAHHISYMAWDWSAEYNCSVPELVNSATGACRGSMGCLIQQDIKSYQPPLAGDVSLGQSTIAIERGDQVEIPLVCVGTTSCRGTLTLTATMPAAAHTARHQTERLGEASFSASPGRENSFIAVALSKTARALVKDDSGHDSTNLTISKTSPTPRTVLTWHINLHYR